jgi:uncharacterized protein with PIN domain
MSQVTVRVYGPLNDFLPYAQRQLAIAVAFNGRTTVKDVVEGVGVPHPEVDLILVNGDPTPFESRVQGGERVAVFPRFYQIDIDGVASVRSSSPDATRFVLDGHLGKLARRLRLCGLDAVCPPGADDDELAALASREHRVLLTRDRELLKRRMVAHGYFVRETDAHGQLVEVLRRFEPPVMAPFSRCLECNVELRAVPKASVESSLPKGVRSQFESFHTCDACRRVYWEGSHWTRLSKAVAAALDEAGINHKHHS